MPALAEVHKRLLEERANIWSQAQGLIDTAEARADKAWTAEDQSAWDAFNKDLDDRDKRIADLIDTMDREQRAAEARARGGVHLPVDVPADHDGDKPLFARDAYNKAFNAYLAGGISAVTPEQRQMLQSGFQDDKEMRIQTAGTTTAGGFTIPQGFYNLLENAMKWYGGMLSPADLPGLPGNDGDNNGGVPGTSAAGVSVIRTDTGNPLPFPNYDDTGNVGARLAEGTTIGTQDVPFASTTLNAFTYTSKAILISWQLLQDSAFDLPTEIAMVAGERLGRILNTELTVGTGTTMPLGVANAATAGKVGATGQTTTVIYDDIIDLEHSVGLAYRARGKFMFHDNTLKVIRKLKDTQGHPLWQPSIQAGVASLFSGREYVINNDMPVPAANARSILFGDFSRYKVRLVRTGSLVQLQERYADQLCNGYFVWIRADGNLINAGQNPITYYANSAT